MEERGEDKGKREGSHDGRVTRLDVARGRTDEFVYKDGEGDEQGKALPGGGHEGADEEEHEGGGEDVAEDKAKEEGFGVGLVDFRGRVWGPGGAGLGGRGPCNDEEKGVDGHDDAHGGELEEDADGGGGAEGE